MNRPLHHRARLTWPEVLAIRDLFTHPHPPPIRSIARTYRVDPHTIRDLLNNVTWATPESPSPPKETSHEP